ncbi:hypothetical protein RHOSPDRAFT_27886 [Rhodotorula sp. JG-1b]|nr:hypothetical protein RHOSPDRAFT_27886 [Rhodotorula sp. JG-1b]
MFGSTFLAGCSVILRTLEGLLAPSATSATPSTPARGFYQYSPTSNQAYSVSAPSTAISVVEKEEEDDSLECPPSPPVSDSSSVYSQSSSDLFDSDTDCDDEEKLDAPLPARSRAFALKLAALHFWLSRSDLSSAVLAQVRSFGIRMIESEETYELQYEQLRLNVKAAKFVEPENVRNDRLRDRLSRALEDFANAQQQASHPAPSTETETEQSSQADSVARLYWPAQSHSRSISSAVSLIASIDSHTIDLSRARSFIRRAPSSSRRVPTPSEWATRSLGKSESLLRPTLDGSVRPAYRAYKRREQHAQATARIASLSRPVDFSARACSGAGADSEVQRQGSRKFAGIPVANPSATPSTAIGLGRPPALDKSTAAPRSRIPIPIATPTKTPTPTSTTSTSGPAQRARKSYGAIEQQRRPPFRV